MRRDDKGWCYLCDLSQSVAEDVIPVLRERDVERLYETRPTLLSSDVAIWAGRADGGWFRWSDWCDAVELVVRVKGELWDAREVGQ